MNPHLTMNNETPLLSNGRRIALPRRRFLQLGLGTLAAQCLPGLRAEDAGTDVVSIIHTTDLHGNILPTSDYDGNADLGGLARCATQIARWREENPNSLLVDAGDLYQGTEVGLRTEGQIMIDTLNHLDFDSWVIGNHEFDWGVDVMEAAVANSRMPVLAANGELGGHKVWTEAGREAGVLKPYFIREVGGKKIAVIGLTTPGMPNWFLPELLGDFVAHDPVPVFEALLREIEDQKPDAILLTCHMGGRPDYFADDEANRIRSITRLCRRSDGGSRIDGIIAGHTHRDIPQADVDGTLYTQAAFFGIQLGRLDLHFDRDSGKLVRADPVTEHMDSSVPLDPSVVALTSDRVEEAEEHLDQPGGELAEEFSHRRHRQNPTDIERLIGASIFHGLRGHGEEVDVVMHGMLFQRTPWEAGTKTVRNSWEIIPFENYLVTAEVTLEALEAIALEAWRSRRVLMGFRASFQGRGESTRVTSMRDSQGRPLEPTRRFRLAVNSYDAAGGGGRLTTLRRVLEEPESRRTLHRLQSRALLVDFLNKHKPLEVADLFEVTGVPDETLL